VQVEGEHGLPYAKPLTRVRETVELIRRLARDGRVRFHGETVSGENFDLWFTPHRRSFPIYVSAVFPKMAALRGEIADGIILTRSTLDTAARIRSHLAEGALRVGRQPGEVTVMSLLRPLLGKPASRRSIRCAPAWPSMRASFRATTA
jgi:alkanesulfonate monooxygenase SsuD/methylene tetrahydromethanopterin reductase-like flavin-dependent oxidoreductase (luciferase family)